MTETAPQRLRARNNWILYLGLVVVVAVTYGQVLGFGFVDYDDDYYILRNPNVQAGLTAASVRWAFTARYMGNWHPIVWLSYLLDQTIYGSRPFGFHLTNLVIHAASTLALFCFLRSLTASIWTSLFCSVVFAIHPINVEPVVWIAERKGLLASLFAILSLGSYLSYARRPAWWRYAVVALWLMLSLASKVFWVALPVIYLLLDYWPLGRIGSMPAPRRTLFWIVLEKVPLAALAAGGIALASWTQGAAGALEQQIPLHFRLANAAVSYWRYLARLVWPRDLSVLYPHPYLAWGTPWSWWQVAAAVALLILVTGIVLALRRGYLTVGWFWFAIAIIPGLGLVQVGVQTTPNRYAYFPIIGLLLALGGGLGQLSRRPRIRPAVVALAIGTILWLGVCNLIEARHWRDSKTLFEQALAIYPTCPTMRNNLGALYLSQGRPAEAAEQFRQALKWRPNKSQIHHNLGRAFWLSGETELAVASYRRALRCYRDGDSERGLRYLAGVYSALAKAFFKSGDLAKATAHFEDALRRWPQLAEAHNGLGAICYLQGDRTAALAHYLTAIQCHQPHEKTYDHAKAYDNLGLAFFDQGNVAAAKKNFLRAVAIKPDMAESWNNLGVVFISEGNRNEAVRCFSEALRSDPSYAEAQANLARLTGAGP